MPEDDKRKPDAGVKTQSSQEVSQKEAKKSDEVKASSAQTPNAEDSSKSLTSKPNTSKNEKAEKADKNEKTNKVDKVELKAEPKPDNKSHPKAEAKPQAKPDVKLYAKPEPKPEAKTTTKTEEKQSNKPAEASVGVGSAKPTVSASNKNVATPLQNKPSENKLSENKPSEERNEEKSEAKPASKPQTKTNSKLSSKYDIKQKDAAKLTEKEVSSPTKVEVKRANVVKKPQKHTSDAAKPVITQDYLFDFAMTQSRISKESENKAKDESVKLSKSQSHDGANRQDVDEEISKDIARKIVASVVESVVESFVESVQIAEMAEMAQEKPNDSDVESSANIDAAIKEFKEKSAAIVSSLNETKATLQRMSKSIDGSTLDMKTEDKAGEKHEEKLQNKNVIESIAKSIELADKAIKTIDNALQDNISISERESIIKQSGKDISEAKLSAENAARLYQELLQKKSLSSSKSNTQAASSQDVGLNAGKADELADKDKGKDSAPDSTSTGKEDAKDDNQNVKTLAEKAEKAEKAAMADKVDKAENATQTVEIEISGKKKEAVEKVEKPTEKPIDKNAQNQVEKQAQKHAEKHAKKERQKMPMIALRDIVAFPKTITPLFIGRAKSVAGAESVTSTTNTVFLCSQKDAAIEKVNDTNLYQVGCVGKIVQCVSIPNGALIVLVDVLYKAKMVKCLDNGNFFEAEVEKVFESEEDQSEQTIIALRRAIIEALENHSVFTKKENESTSSLVKISDHREFVGMLVSSLPADNKAKQQILESKDLISTLESILLILMQESEILKADKLIKEKVEAQIKKNNKEYYLNEQVKAIKQELGESDSVTGAADKYEKLLPTTNFTPEARAKAEEEIRRLRTMNAMSSENTRAYLDMLFAIPWGKYDKGNSDILHSIKVLMNSHYGLEKVKESVLEYLAVQMNNENSKGAILCLYGPPGVGKTTLVKSIAEAMGRKYAKISLGGVRDEAEIRGHRRTYVGAMPGKLVQTIKRLGVCNPVILLDEIDKVGRDHRGDPESALLEVLDPDQNSTFQDHYLEIGYDLSRVMFVTTANDFSSMSRPLLDRLEVVNVSGYLEHEKIEICKNHIIKKQIENIGIPADKFSISTDAIRDIIKYYTREAGVRELDRLIGKTVRKGLICQMAKQEGMEMEIDGFRDMFAKSILPKINPSHSGNGAGSAGASNASGASDSVNSVDSSDLVDLEGKKAVKFSENDSPIEVTSANLARFLGTKKYTRHTSEKEDLIGVTNGLAYTESGGDVLLIEAVKLTNSKGGVTITGRLGEVMKESAEMVVGYVKSRAEDFGINLENLSKQGIHIHFPDGATPKDGPSAGIAICTTIVSLLSGIGVKHNIAMTGEITLRGRVLPIGGLREKLVAALRNGIDTVLLPKENEKDLQEVPSHVKDNLKIILCSHIDEVLEHALMEKPFVTGYKPRMPIVEDSGMLLIQ